MIKINPLDFIPVQVRKIQSMDKGSKEYKKAIDNLRLNNRAYVYSMINQSKPDEFSYPFTKEYRKHLFSTLIFSALMLIVFIVGFIIIGQTATEEITKPDIIKLVILFLMLVLISSIAMIYALKARKVMDNYIGALIEQTQIRCPHFSDELLSLVSSAYFCIAEKQELIDDIEKYGCINCLRIFNGKEIKDSNNKAIICPYCGTEHLLRESPGYPITGDFLSAMKEYWIDVSN